MCDAPCTLVNQQEITHRATFRHSCASYTSKIVLLLYLTVGFFAGCGVLNTRQDQKIQDQQIPVETFKTIDSEPAWSPDGVTIAYTHVTSVSGEPTGIWLLDLSTEKKHFLTPGMSADWSPDGRQLVYVKNTNIFVTDTSASNQQQLTDWGDCYNPDWSADGKRIAFDTNRNDPKGANVIWLMNVDGSDKIDISQHGVGEWREPKWRQDGQSILHIRYTDHPTPDLYVVNSEGTNAIRLTNNNRTDDYPTWSPDGKHIVWDSYGGGTGGIWIMNADGSEQHLLIPYGGFPSWSPDGKSLVYYAAYDDQHGSLWISRSDGSNARLITRMENYQK